MGEATVVSLSFRLHFIHCRSSPGLTGCSFGTPFSQPHVTVRLVPLRSLTIPFIHSPINCLIPSIHSFRTVSYIPFVAFTYRSLHSLRFLVQSPSFHSLTLPQFSSFSFNLRQLVTSSLRAFSFSRCCLAFPHVSLHSMFRECEWHYIHSFQSFHSANHTSLRSVAFNSSMLSSCRAPHCALLSQLITIR